MDKLDPSAEDSENAESIRNIIEGFKSAIEHLEITQEKLLEESEDIDEDSLK